LLLVAAVLVSLAMLALPALSLGLASLLSDCTHSPYCIIYTEYIH